MKELIAAFSDATVNRLKSPILGSFVLSWIVINHVLLLTFIFSTSQQKIILLQSDFPFWSLTPSIWSCPPATYLIYPAIASIIYTFGLPWLQHLIDTKKFRLIDSKRITEKHRTDRFIYSSQKRTNRVRAESNLDYWKNKLNRDLDNWDNKRQVLENDVSQLRLERDSLQSQLTSSNTIQINLSEEVEKLRKLQHDEKEQFLDQESALIGELNKVKSVAESLLKTSDELDETNRSLEALKEEVNQSKEEITEYKEKLSIANQQHNEDQDAIETLLVKFYDLTNVLTDIKQYQHLPQTRGSSAGIQTIMPKVKIDKALKPIIDIVEQKAEPIKIAKLKQQLTEKHQMTQQELEKVQKSLASLEGPSKAQNIWD